MFSVGHQLMKARQARQHSIEDVAFETRIPHTRLRDMENDDLSNFANLTYAKGFLKLYSRYLNLDLSDYLDEFDTRAISDVTGHEYARSAGAVRLLSDPAIAPDDGHRTRVGASALGVAALTAVLLGGGWVIYKAQSGGNPTSPQNRPAKSEGTVAAPANTAARPVNTLANADTGALIVPRAPAATVAPKATIVPNDTVRKATPVDDDGNEVRTIRPERL